VYKIFKNILDDVVSLPIGRGTYRGSSSGIRNIDIAHFRAARPESSLGATGKQGLIK